MVKVHNPPPPLESCKPTPPRRGGAPADPRPRGLEDLEDLEDPLYNICANCHFRSSTREPSHLKAGPGAGVVADCRKDVF